MTADDLVALQSMVAAQSGKTEDPVLEEALDLLEACAGCDLYYDAYGALTLDKDDKRRVMDFVEAFLDKHRPLDAPRIHS